VASNATETAQYLGGGATYTSGTWTGPTYTFKSGVGGKYDNVGSALSYLDSENGKQDIHIANLSSGLNSLNKELQRLDEENDENSEGVAMALAMSMPVLPEWKHAAISANFGHFEGESAFALAGVVRVDDRVAVHGGLGVGLEEGTTGGRVGVSVGW
jgi:hypothetical protein